jgi:hypothetical protein
VFDHARMSLVEQRVGRRSIPGSDEPRAATCSLHHGADATDQNHPCPPRLETLHVAQRHLSGSSEFYLGPPDPMTNQAYQLP